MPRILEPLRLARVLLVVLPALPGLLFLAVGLLLDLHTRTSGAAADDTVARARVAAQARGLYLAGAVTLLAGTVGMAAVVWKIARTSPEEEIPATEHGEDG